ncbi:hypothetical protein ACFC1B_07370 [Streptomyces xiamenensis]|uniref:hypothetical protein n=1 Tax=Streptomyces xiamenensis TaxID=408015 RepID=UPI0035DCA939
MASLRNAALDAALAQAGWTPRDLIRALNPRLDAIGEPRLHLSAAHPWTHGSVPRNARVRCLAAAVLSEATGSHVTVVDLWPRAAGPADPTGLSATTGLTSRRSLDQVLATAAAWARTAPEDQAALHPAPESALFAAAWDATRQGAAELDPPRGSDRVLPPLMDLLDGHLRDLRRLDDRAGGGSLSQRYVHTALNAVLDLLRNSHYTETIGRRLLGNAAGLAQLAGWMAFDAGLAPAAHRHQLLAIRLARAAGDTATVANALGMLAYQHAADRRFTAAVRFAEAAVENSARCAPIVRARAAGRLATARAAAGDLAGFRAASAACRQLLDHRRPDDPASLYYLTPQQVEAEAGAALVDLAASTGRTRPLLTEAIALLAPLAEQGPHGEYLRSAVLHGTHLARAHLMARDAESAAQTLAHVAGAVPHIQSIRCRLRLGHLRADAAARLRGPNRTDALSAVDAALSAP